MSKVIEKVGGLSELASLRQSELLLRWRRAVGSAGSLTLAAVLTGMLCVAAALALAIILALAGVLRGSGGSLILCDEEQASVSWRSGVVASTLSIQTSGGPTEKSGKCGGEGEVVYGIDLHEKHLSWLGRAISCAGHYGLR